jgi:hypothetical protein
MFSRIEVSARFQRRASAERRRGAAAKLGHTLKPRALGRVREKSGLLPDLRKCVLVDLDIALCNVQLAQDGQQEGRLAAPDISGDDRCLSPRYPKGSAVRAVSETEREVSLGVPRKGRFRSGRDFDSRIEGFVVLFRRLGRPDRDGIIVKVFGLGEEAGDPIERDASSHPGREEVGGRNDCLAEQAEQAHGREGGTGGETLLLDKDVATESRQGDDGRYASREEHETAESMQESAPRVLSRERE